MPYITDDLDIVWALLLDTYGDECFTPNIVKKFPAQFQKDVKVQKNEIMKFDEQFSAELEVFEKKV